MKKNIITLIENDMYVFYTHIINYQFKKQKHNI